jgi:two-component system sensor histidine kinase GlrK
MERAADLYGIMGDVRVAQRFENSFEAFKATLLELAAYVPDTDIRAVRGDGEAAADLVRAGGPEGRAGLRSRFQALNDAADRLSQHARLAIDGRLKEVESEARATQQGLLWALMALVPAALTVAGVFWFFVLRPLRAIDRAISDLGRGAFSHAIAISGPADLAALGRQLEWLRTRLLDIALERNRFLRHMSHELKTPLANIREGTDLLLDGAVGPIDDNQREVTSILRENALRLQQLIENLLSYSAWKSRASSVELTSFRLSSLVGTVIDSQRLAMAARSITLDMHVADMNLVADRAKLKLVLENLLSNALKFTPRGGTIHLHAYPDGATTVIDCADTGPGIAADEREKVFDAFYSGNAPHGGPLKGTGIGLSVVREFVEAHGGTVEIVTGTYPGAHLRIRLPAATRRESAHAA